MPRALGVVRALAELSGAFGLSICGNNTQTAPGLQKIRFYFLSAQIFDAPAVEDQHLPAGQARRLLS
jgi:hypothetical protein